MAHRGSGSPLGDDKLPGMSSTPDALARQEEGVDPIDEYDVQRVEQVYR